MIVVALAVLALIGIIAGAVVYRALSKPNEEVMQEIQEQEETQQELENFFDQLAEPAEESE
jgi:uncharacterized membrane-anchored protein YhcB (DUF1043 family)